MSTKKILMICIPTYNRAEKLKECVNSILEQMDEEMQRHVEIHIFDNASMDGTEAYCKELIAEHPYIGYTRNQENVGPDKNFYKILQYETETRFKHLLSDDDKYAPRSLKKLVEYLSTHDTLHFVYLNYANFKTADSDRSYGALSPSSETKSYIQKSELIQIVKNEFSFLSGMVFNTEAVDLTGIEQYSNTNWLQSYALFRSTANSEGKIGFYGPVVVLKRSDDEEVNYNVFKVFGRNYLELAKYAYEQCGYNKRQLQKLVAIRWKKLLFFARLKGVEKSEYADIVKIAKKEKGLKKVAFYAHLPRWLCRAYHKLKYLF